MRHKACDVRDIFLLLLVCCTLVYSQEYRIYSSDAFTLSTKNTTLLKITENGTMEACPADGSLTDICNTLNFLLADAFSCDVPCLLPPKDRNLVPTGAPSQNDVCKLSGVTTGCNQTERCTSVARCCDNGLADIGGSCSANIDCCSGYCGGSSLNLYGTCQEASCFSPTNNGTCSQDSDCCFTYDCNLSTKKCYYVGAGCFTGDTPVVLADGTVKQTQDLVVGDVIATPVGPAEVIFFTEEEYAGLQLFTWNSIHGGWATREQPFAKYGDYNSWYSPVVEADIAVWPWLDGVIHKLGDGSVLMYFDASTNTTSPVVVSNYTVSEEIFEGNVYYYIAWPLWNTTRVPQLYMIGHGYVGYSPFQSTVNIAATSVCQTLAITALIPALLNPPIPLSSLNLMCWAVKFADLVGRWLSDGVSDSYISITTLTPPTSPPSSYDGPAAEWFPIMEANYRKLGYKKRLSETIVIDHPDYDKRTLTPEELDAYTITAFRLGQSFVVNGIWLNWIPFSVANATITAVLDKFSNQLATYDFSSLALSCYAE